MRLFAKQRNEAINIDFSTPRREAWASRIVLWSETPAEIGGQKPKQKRTGAIMKATGNTRTNAEEICRNPTFATYQELLSASTGNRRVPRS